MERWLKKYFGFSDFRPGQKEIVEALLANRNLLSVMPTGAGKSICYQLPAMLSDYKTIIVSPLVSLMQDQVSALATLGIPATVSNLDENNRRDPLLGNQVVEDKRRTVFNQVRPVNQHHRPAFGLGFSDAPGALLHGTLARR